MNYNKLPKQCGGKNSHLTKLISGTQIKSVLCPIKTRKAGRNGPFEKLFLSSSLGGGKKESGIIMYAGLAHMMPGVKEYTKIQLCLLPQTDWQSENS